MRSGFTAPSNIPVFNNNRGPNSAVIDNANLTDDQKEWAKDLLGKYDESMDHVIHTHMVEKANKDHLADKLKEESRFPNILRGVVHRAGAFLSKSGINNRLHAKEPELRAYAKSMVGSIADATSHLKNKETYENDKMLHNSQLKLDRTSAEYLGLLRYLTQNNITVDSENIQTLLDRQHIMKSAGEGELSVRDILHHFAAKHIVKTKAYADESKITDDDLLDINVAYTGYCTEYSTLQSMQDTEKRKSLIEKQGNNYVVKNGKLKATRRKGLGKLGEAGIYGTLGLGTKLLLSTALPYTAVPLVAGAAITAYRTYRRKKNELKTPEAFMRNIFAASAQVHKEAAGNLKLKPEDKTPQENWHKSRMELYEKYAKDKDWTITKLNSYIKNKATMDELITLYSTLLDYQDKIVMNGKTNSVHSAYIGAFQKNLFETINERSLSGNEEVNFREIVKTNKGTENLLNLKIDLKAREMKDGIIEKVKNKEWRQIAGGVAQSLLFSGAIYGAGYGIGAAKEYIGSRIEAVTEVSKASVPTKVSDPVTAGFIQESPVSQAQTSSTGANLYEAVKEKTSSFSTHSETNLDIDDDLKQYIDPSTVNAGNVEARFESLAKAYENGVLTEAQMDQAARDFVDSLSPQEKLEFLQNNLNADGKAKLNELIALYKEGKIDDEALKAGTKDIVNNYPGNGPKMWGFMTAVRKGMTHIADGNWGPKGSWFYGLGTHPLLGIDMENSMGWGNWKLYNNATANDYGNIVKTLAAGGDIVKNTAYLAITEPLEKAVRLQGLYGELWGVKNTWTDFEIDVYTKKLLATIGAAGGETFNGETANDIRNSIQAFRNDPQNLKALLAGLAITAVVGTIIYKKNKEGIGKFWKSTKDFYGSIKKFATGKVVIYPAMVIAPALYLWKRYPAKWTIDGVKSLVTTKAEAPAASGTTTAN